MPRIQRWKEFEGTKLYSDIHSGKEISGYEYLDEDGKRAFIILRQDWVDEDGKKQKDFLPFLPDGEEARLPDKYKKKAGSRPFYNRGAIPSEGYMPPVVIVEGEKSQEAAERVFPGHAVLTWYGGVGGLEFTDWKPLKRANVLLIADTDQAGRDAMRDLARSLTTKSGPGPCRVRIYAEPGESKADIADWAAGLDGPGIDALRKKIEEGAVLPGSLPEKDTDPAPFEIVQPWTEEVDGAAALSALAEAIGAHMHMAPHQADTVALWAALTWLHDHPGIEVAPFLNITAPTIASGKSTLLQIVEEFVRHPLADTGSSEAYLFRVIEQYGPTLLMDEIDLKSKENQLFQSMLNGSQTRKTAYIGRAEQKPDKSIKTKRFPT